GRSESGEHLVGGAKKRPVTRESSRVEIGLDQKNQQLGGRLGSRWHVGQRFEELSRGQPAGRGLSCRLAGRYRAEHFDRLDLDRRAGDRNGEVFGGERGERLSFAVDASDLEGREPNLDAIAPNGNVGAVGRSLGEREGWRQRGSQDKT